MNLQYMDNVTLLSDKENFKNMRIILYQIWKHYSFNVIQ